jgi:Arc/MetJ-type ribon-helix-helix transcriptional regulator
MRPPAKVAKSRITLELPVTLRERIDDLRARTGAESATEVIRRAVDAFDARDERAKVVDFLRALKLTDAADAIGRGEHHVTGGRYAPQRFLVEDDDRDAPQRFLVEDDDRDEVHFECGSCESLIVLLTDYADELLTREPACPVCGSSMADVTERGPI